jgi:uncharacterized membrane protein
MASEREAGAERIIAFSDGVVAIAITLLVLPLTEIDRPPDATLAELVGDNQTALFAFALSFVVIANFWMIHHGMFRSLRRQSTRLMQLNILWLAAIVFLPFPTALIADGLEGGFSTLYIGTLLAVSLLDLLLTTYLARHPELSDGPAAADSRQRAIGSGLSAAALLVALIISVFSPTAGIWALLLLVPTQIIAGRLPSSRSRAKPAQP